MMFGNRIEFNCELETATPLHFGTGEFGDLTFGNRAEPLHFAAVQRDADGNPYLAATGLKGAIRAFAETEFSDDAGPDLASLFGTIETKGSGPRMGSLVIYGAKSAHPGKAAELLPYAPSLNRSAAYIAARTAIDGAAGVADDHKLFFQELIQPGTKFSFRCLLLSHGSKEEVELAEQIFARLLRDGLSLGKSRADGQGQVRFKKVTFAAWNLGEDGVLRRGSERVIAAEKPEESGNSKAKNPVFILSCNSPFLVQDASQSELRNTRDPERVKKGSAPQIQAQKSAPRQALLPASSVAGALRARAVWLWRREHLRKGSDLREADGSVNRLFGSLENMALLHIKRCEVSEAEPFEITSVKLDRFTGGPVDNALFTTGAFTGVRLTLEIALTRRPGFEPMADDAALFELLCRDIKDNGLDLGAGSSKGFGWFKTEQAHGA